MKEHKLLKFDSFKYIFNMNYTIYILSCFLFWGTILQGQSAYNDYALEDLRELQLNNSNLVIYQKQAIIKLQDLLGYLSLVGNNQYDKTFRSMAMKSVLSHFDETASITCSWIPTPSRSKKPPNHNVSSTCHPEQIIKKLLQNPYEKFQLTSQQVNVKKKLHQLLDGNYQGQLVYTQQSLIQSSKKSNSIKEEETVVTMNFLLKRVLKKFGTKSEEVWEIKFLGMP